MISVHVYEVRPRRDKRGVDLTSDALPFGTLWYGEPNAISNAIGYAEYYSRSHDALIRVYDDAGNVTETHEHKGDFKSHEAYRSPPCRHGKGFGFVFRVKYCSRTSPSHCRYVVLASAANYHECSEESYQHFH
jgi:hypothetical protein